MRRLCSASVFSFFLVFSAVVAAQPAPSVTLEDGASFTVENGKLALVINGRSAHSFKLEDTDPKGRADLKRIDLADGLVAVHAGIEAKGAKTREVVVVRKPAARRFQVIWDGLTGLSGDPGERVGQAVRFEDLTGDGIPEIVVGTVAESVRLCGKEKLPLLFRRVYDPNTGKLRSVLARRPGLAEPADLTGLADPGDHPVESLVHQVSPAAVSRAAGDGENPIMLAPPQVLADNDPSTFWTPVPGNGAGEFATFKVHSQDYKITRIGVRPFAADTGRARYDSPRSALLTTSEQVFRLVFPKEAPDPLGQAVWFDLPSPVKTSCLSLIIETTSAPKANRPVAIADVIALTEVDSPAGLERLARDLLNPELRAEAARLLEKVGPRSVPEIRKAWPDLDVPARRLAAGVLSEVGLPGGIDLLVEAAVGKDEIASNNALRGIIAAGDAAVEPLGAVLNGEDPQKGEAAARLLSSIGSQAALFSLASACGKGGRKKRAILRYQIAIAAGRSSQRTAQLWQIIQSHVPARDKELLLDIVRAAAPIPALSKDLSELARQLYRESESFADRYRLLTLMGALDADAPQDLLIAAASDPDHLIRAAAVAGLGRPERGADQILDRALRDSAPEVRMAALDAAGQAGRVLEVHSALAKLASDEPWPHVRAKVALLAARLPPEKALPILSRAIGDKSAQVRLAALDSAIRIQDQRADQIIETRLKAADEKARIKSMAAWAAGKRCQRSALPALFDLVTVGAEPLADFDQVSVAVSAAKAMGRIGGQQAKELLEKASRRSNPATDRAIAAALKTLGAGCR